MNAYAVDLGTLLRKAWYAELIIGYVSFDVLPYAWLWHDISFWKCASARSAIIDCSASQVKKNIQDMNFAQ